jgi:hypothetical protein
MAVRLYANLVLLNRIHPFVAVLLVGAPSGVASSVEEHKRVWQLPVDRGMGKIGDGRSRVACTGILNVIDEWWRLGQRIGSTKKQHRRYPKKYPGEIQIPEELTHGVSPFALVGVDCQGWDCCAALERSRRVGRILNVTD